jgi:hypothetical protein
MRRPLLLLAVAGLLAAAHVATSLAGFADHLDAVVGMPAFAGSWLCAAIHIADWLLAVVVAPIFAIAGALALVLRRLRG